MAYLTSKGFSEDRVAEIVRGAPNWLEFSVEDVDAKLGFFQGWDFSYHFLASILNVKLFHIQLSDGTCAEVVQADGERGEEADLPSSRTHHLGRHAFSGTHLFFNLRHVDLPAVPLSRRLSSLFSVVI